MNSEEKYEEILKKDYDFKKIWLNDKSGFWLEKKLNHSILKNLKICIDSNKIIIFYDHKNKMVEIFEEKFSFKLLNKVINGFQN